MQLINDIATSRIVMIYSPPLCCASLQFPACSNVFGLLPSCEQSELYGIVMHHMAGPHIKDSFAYPSELQAITTPGEVYICYGYHGTIATPRC